MKKPLAYEFSPVPKLHQNDVVHNIVFQKCNVVTYIITMTANKKKYITVDDLFICSAHKLWPPKNTVYKGWVCNALILSLSFVLRTKIKVCRKN
jgi:hypothetical protein